MKKVAKRRNLSSLYRDVLRESGALSAEPKMLDLVNTPKRVQSMLENELLSSYQEDALESLHKSFTTFDLHESSSPMIVEVDIPYYSLCAHHMVPFFGRAHIGYIPGARVAGLSKLPRVVDYFSRKLQMQERLVSEVADFLHDKLEAKATLVFMEGRHLCMEMRGIRKPGVLTRTSALRGEAMGNPSVLQEFYTIIGLSR